MKYLLIILIILFTGCRSYTRTYKVTDSNYRNYYVNCFSHYKDKITFNEIKRDGILKPMQIVYAPYSVITLVKGDTKCNKYIKELIEMGYSKEWATHKALVEHGFIPEDKEYLAIEED
jgi:hypothetical protein